MALGAVLLVVGQSVIRPLEARVSAQAIRITQVAPARPQGTAVIFPLNARYVGFDITAGCTAALLVIPFFLLAAGLVVTRRTSVARGVSTLAAVAVALFTVNQARLLVVALSMRLWGFDRGYEVSHVFLGTVVSTLGVLAGVLLYVRSVVANPARAGVGG
jgi:exosortase/archaeosortase family protein